MSILAVVIDLSRQLSLYVAKTSIVGFIGHPLLSELYLESRFMRP
mgnify:CR=1 FL=1|jgi:hypothetical protein